METLAANKTLTPGADVMYQYLDEGDANRTITLATVGATAGDRFIIRHNGVYNDTHYLAVYQGATELDRIWAASFKEVIFDGTNWVAAETGTGQNDARRNNIAIGYKANAYTSGIAVGYNAQAQGQGVAIGVSSAAPACRWRLGMILIQVPLGWQLVANQGQVGLGPVVVSLLVALHGHTINLSQLLSDFTRRLIGQAKPQSI